MLEIGSYLNNKYKILSVIGSGGMSVVYLALNERVNKTWAIKEVRKDGGNDAQVKRQNLVAEVDILKDLKHPHLPSIVDIVDTEDSFIMVMDYVEGESLEKIMKRTYDEKNFCSKPLSKENVLEWAKQLCDVLGYLHNREHPIIYRDMKPGNIMLRPDNSVALIDFGTAREYKESSIEDTTCLGSRGYAAPEQYGGKGQTDQRTDIFGLGMTMYHLLTGHSPAEPPYKVYPIGKWIPEYAGSGLENIVQKCTQEDPNARYQSCAELLYALDHVNEEDAAVRVIRERKWRSFVAACLVTLVGVGGMIGCRIGWQKQVEDGYTAFMDNARNAASVEEAVDYYTKAITMIPDAEQAYQEVVGLMDRDYELTSSEGQLITGALMHTEGGSKTSLDMLRDGDRQAYDKLAYRLGCDYYFCYEGADKRTKAASWFSKVLESKYLTAAQKRVATSLNKIGNYYESLSQSGGKYDFINQGSTYLDYWHDLVNITDGDLKAATGHNYAVLGLYKTLAVELYNCGPQFAKAGITEEQMREQLRKIRDGLKQLEAEMDAEGKVSDEDSDRAAMARLEENITAAESMIRSCFSGPENA